MLKKNLTIVLLLSVAASVFAEEVEIDGLWYNLNPDEKEAQVIQYKKSSTYSGNIVIPENVVCDGASYSVTSIGDKTFMFCGGLTSVTIPNSVTSIGMGAFYGCSDLMSITIPNDVTSIEDCTFMFCSGLTSVTIPNSVTNIGNYAFSGCKRIRDAV